MKYGLFTIRDKVAEAGGFPFSSKNVATAARAFREYLSKQSGLLDPHDLELLQVGLWDDEKCQIESDGKSYVIDVAIPPSRLMETIHESTNGVMDKKEPMKGIIQ